MFPPFNVPPFHPNNVANPSSAPQQQQVMGINPGNFAPNPMQIQPQMGLMNPQTAIPFNNLSVPFIPNQFLPNYPITMNQMNNMNNLQPMPQIFGQNLNLGFPNQIQPDINRIFQFQMPNFNTQPVPTYLCHAQNPTFVANTQPANLILPQSIAFVPNTRPASLSLPQNVAFVANTQLGFPDSTGIMQQTGNSNACNGTPNASQQFQGSSSLCTGTPNSIQQLQGSSSLVQGFGPIRPSQNQKSFHPRPSKFQGNLQNGMETHMMRNDGKSPQYKNFKRNPKHESPRNGFMKPKFNKMQNTKGNFNPRNIWLRRGNENDVEKQISVVNSAIQAQVDKKRSISLTYTEKEIQEWREERRKNYPSKANVEKKLIEKLTKPEVGNKVAKMRRQVRLTDLDDVHI